MQWYIDVVKKYVEYNGRARRKEYWMFTLFNFIITLVLSLIDELLGTWGIISIIYGLAILLPASAVCIRRLHDTNRSGWWLLITLIPLIGAIIILIFTIQDSEPGTNQYGPNPKMA